jgi:glucose-1-phosphate thymidylyltransferase
MTDLAVVLAAGRGTRLRQASEQVRLTPSQETAATTGIKALMPVGPLGSQRPIIDYILTSLADAGVRQVCIVTTTADEPALADHFEGAVLSRLAIRFVHQREPRGTADAILAARQTVGDRPFLSLGCDTWMSSDVLARLARQPGCAMLAFARARLIAADTNLDDEKVRGFALLDLSAPNRSVPSPGGARYLEGVREKPDPATWATLSEPVFLSLNAWRFDRSIFDACAAIAPSPRGELELPDAVQWLIDRGTTIRALPTESPALDLTHRSDAGSFSHLIGDIQISL